MGPRAKLNLMKDSLPFAITFVAEVYSFDCDEIMLRADLKGVRWEWEGEASLVENLEVALERREVEVTIGRPVE